jgi:hypothetical protein
MNANSNIKNFVIFGERCSGSNFLEEAIINNFHLILSNEYGNKHFFCFHDFSKRNTENTLFIGIIRNPIYWLNSFFANPWHVPNKNRELNNFLFAEFYSICDEKKTANSMYSFISNGCSETHEINRLDLNYKTGAKYKNIFELRKLKNDYLINVMPSKVENYILINYEDLLYNYEDVLENMKNKFRLNMKHPLYKKITYYKKTSVSYKGEKKIAFTPQQIEIIWKHLDMSQENNLGYYMGDNNNYFKNKNKNKPSEINKEIE